MGYPCKGGGLSPSRFAVRDCYCFLILMHENGGSVSVSYEQQQPETKTESFRVRAAFLVEG